jgi:hypothetical protein
MLIYACLFCSSQLASMRMPPSPAKAKASTPPPSSSQSSPPQTRRPSCRRRAKTSSPPASRRSNHHRSRRSGSTSTAPPSVETRPSSSSAGGLKQDTASAYQRGVTEFYLRLIMRMCSITPVQNRAVSLELRHI